MSSARALLAQPRASITRATVVAQKRYVKMVRMWHEPLKPEACREAKLLLGVDEIVVFAMVKVCVEDYLQTPEEIA